MSKTKLTIIAVALFSMASLSQATNTQHPEYNITIEYAGNSIVLYKGSLYTNAWYANAGQCPVKEDCLSGYTVGQWKVYDPTVKHEFDYYNYTDLQANYPKLPVCTSSEYSKSHVQSIINTSGEISKAAPGGGFSQHDKDALYSEFMLPCKPVLDLSNINSLPSNVQAVMRVVTAQNIWI